MDSIFQVPIQNVSKKETCFFARTNIIQNKQTNFVYENNKLFFGFLRLWGVFPLYQNHDGTFEFRWISWRTLYSFVAVALQLLLAIYCGYTMVKNLMAVPFSYTQATTYSALLTCGIVSWLNVFSLWEVRKFAHFLNNWQAYQKTFERLSHDGLQQKEAKNWILLVMSAWLCSAVITESSQNTLKFNYGPLGDKKLSHYIIILTFMYTDTILFNHIYLWSIITGTIHHSGEKLISSVEKMHWRYGCDLGGHMNLWIWLRRICKQCGYVLSWTYMFLLSSLFLMSLPYLFMAADLLSNGDASHVGPSIHALLCISCVADLAHKAIEKIGTEFEERLTDLLLSQNTKGYEKQLRTFIKTVSAAKPVISLAGFLQLDRQLNASLYSNAITYFVIIIQFRADFSNQWKDAPERTNRN